jgi:hypothetical protein
MRMKMDTMEMLELNKMMYTNLKQWIMSKGPLETGPAQLLVTSFRANNGGSVKNLTNNQAVEVSRNTEAPPTMVLQLGPAAVEDPGSVTVDMKEVQVSLQAPRFLK